MSSASKTYLPGIPAPFQCESVNSWMQRVCQVYDLTFSSFHDIFGTQNGLDPDVCFSRQDFNKFAKISRIPLERFFVMQACFGRIAEFRWLRRLLLIRSNGHPVYRYCPHCWLADRIPYFRLEWRFMHWKICQLHHLPMQDRCWNCKSYVPMHRAVLGGTRIPPPVPNLAFCLFCSADLRLIKDSTVDFSKKEELASAIAFQRAIVSAVLHGYFLIQPLPERYKLSKLFKLLDGVGLEGPNERSGQYLNHMEDYDRQTLEWIINEALKGAPWLARRHPQRANAARQLFGIWAKPAPSGKVFD